MKRALALVFVSLAAGAAIPGSPCGPAAWAMCQNSTSSQDRDVLALLEGPSVPNGGRAAWLRVAAYSLMGVATLGVHYLFGALYVVLLEDLAEPFPVC